MDNILIDEARTPLIISGQAEESADLYFTFARLVPAPQGAPEGAEEGGDFFIDLKDKAVSSTEEGVEKMEGWLGVENMYDADPRLARHFEQALRAHALYKRDRDYIVKDGEIVIVDEFTGRQMPGRRWSEGLHQAIEAKEGLRVQRESVTLATITFQNYFRLYDKLSGMTGTAMTEAEEFHKIYKLEVVAIPTHRDMVRDDEADLVFRDEKAKFNALIEEIVEMQEAGRPVLVGTVSVEKSEILSTMLKRRGIEHEVLNAKFHEKESGIVAQAGRSGAVTIATNMAGRGTDILLGGNPAGLASDLAPQARPQPGRGGRRDLRRGARRGEGRHRGGPRARGRGGRPAHHRHRAPRLAPHRQPAPRPCRPPGRPGLVALLPVARRRPDEALRQRARHRAHGAASASRTTSPSSRGWCRATIESAQSRVEGFNFDIRKRVVEYDDVINKQRETIYAERDKVLHNEDLTETVRAFLDEEIDVIVETDLAGDDPDEWNLDGLSMPRRRWASPARAPAPTSCGTLGSRDAIAEHLRDLADARLDARAAEVGAADWAHRRAPGPGPDDRLALGGAPDRDRRHAPRHRPARVRAAGPAQRVPPRGIPPLRGAPRASSATASRPRSSA